MLLEGSCLIKDEDYVRYYPRALTYVLSCNRNLPFTYPAASLLIGIPLKGQECEWQGSGHNEPSGNPGLAPDAFRRSSTPHPQERRNHDPATLSALRAIQSPRAC